MSNDKSYSYHISLSLSSFLSSFLSLFLSQKSPSAVLSIDFRKKVPKIANYHANNLTTAFLQTKYILNNPRISGLLYINFTVMKALDMKY